MTGRAYGGIGTPHVVDFERHVNPANGEVFVPWINGPDGHA
ncbi:hypothetical protein F1D97_05855 [Cellulomonas palmilytica]|nr:hypothetical protein F1D97_05855 [Cellulomonas palmilytica]